jgi:hypothetical protein
VERIAAGLSADERTWVVDYAGGYATSIVHDDRMLALRIVSEDEWLCMKLTPLGRAIAAALAAKAGGK